MPQTKPKISVLVPVYKAEATLDACVTSVLAQTFPDFELLLAVSYTHLTLPTILRV